MNNSPQSSRFRETVKCVEKLPILYVSGALFGLMLLTLPVLAHGGHGNEFQGGGKATQSASAIKVDAETAKRMGLKVEAVTRQPLSFGIQATGQIEVLPSQKVEVTNPVGGTVARLFVQPGESVKAGQPLALLTSPDLAELRTDALDRRTEAGGSVQKAQADLRLAQRNYQQQQKIAIADINQVRVALKFAQEKYDRDQQLTTEGAIPKRQFLESESELAEAKANLTDAESRLQVSEAIAQLERAQSDLQVAQSQVQLSGNTYETRLSQLGATANSDGTMTIVAPISGKVADREVTLGQSAQDAGEILMTIVNDRSVLAAANIYEKDLDRVSPDQRVRVRVASLPDRVFEGRITIIDSVVNSETRVVPVKAEIDNPEGVLKPGMSAQLEVLTDRTPTAVVTIPKSAVVEANGKRLVYVQNGNAYEPVEVTFGKTAGEKVEVKGGVFDGDMIVTQRAAQLYAQSLKGGSQVDAEGHGEVKESGVQSTSAPLPWWAIAAGSGALATGTFWAGSFWANRQTRKGLVAALHGDSYSANGHSTNSHSANGHSTNGHSSHSANGHPPVNHHDSEQQRDAASSTPPHHPR
jgi:membrane fusion protein, heavy metal efflux system